MACALGANPAYAVAAISTLEPVENRLVFEKTARGSYLRDAYNSNPLGFKSALEVLKGLPGERKILMTPGMIELGDQQVKENEIAGELAGQAADLVLIVGPINRDALTRGLIAAGMAKDKIIPLNTRDEAFITLSELEQPGDVILIENDLTDLYEGAVRF